MFNPKLGSSSRPSRQDHNVKVHGRHITHSTHPEPITDWLCSIDSDSSAGNSEPTSENVSVDERRSAQKHRVPNDDSKFVETISRANVDVTNMHCRRIDLAEPRASQSTHSERHSSERRARSLRKKFKGKRIYDEDQWNDGGRNEWELVKGATTTELPSSSRPDILQNKSGSGENVRMEFNRTQSEKISTLLERACLNDEQIERSQTVLSSVEAIRSSDIQVYPLREPDADEDTSFSGTMDNQSNSEDQDASNPSTSGEPRWELDLALEQDHPMTPVLDPARRALADRVMDEFWVLFNQNWTSNISRQGAGDSSQGSSSSQPQSISQLTSTSQQYRAKRRKIDDEEESGDGDGKGRKRRDRSHAPGSDANDSLRFACPYRKHDASRYNIYIHRVCALSNWGTIARVKEHLYRCHQKVLHCKRCWQTFKSQNLLDQHMTVDAASICQAKPGHSPDCLTVKNLKNLRKRAKAFPNQSDAERWRDIYKMLFPGEEIPSPYFEPVQEEGRLSPDSHNLANFEEYARRELPRLVCRDIKEVLRREMQLVEASLVDNLVNTVRDCQDRLFRSYSEMLGGVAAQSTTPAEPQSHPTSDANAAEEGLALSPSQLLSSSFRHPTPLADSETENSAQNSAQSLHSTTGDSLFSAFCNCPGFCTCSFAFTNFNHIELDSQYLPDEGFDIDDGPSDWQNWDLNNPQNGT